MALDIASVTGLAVGLPTDRKPSFVAKRVAFPDDDLGQALVRFEAWLLDQLAVHQPTTLAFEAPLMVVGAYRTTRPTNQVTVRLLFGLAAVAELVGTRAGLQVFEANVQEVRKHFCGSGRADKAAVMNMCRLMGWMVPDHNAADSAACWSFARACLFPEHAHTTTPLFRGEARP